MQILTNSRRRTTSSRTLILAAGLALVAGSGLAACGGDDDASSGGGDGVRVTDAWARTSPAMADTGAVYFSVSSADGDVLIGGSVDASVASTVELHETVMADGDDMGGHGGDTTMAGGMGSGTTMAGGMGEMTMQEVDTIEIPAGETVSLKPGGLHIMLPGLAAPLEAGSTFELTLSFEKAGEVTVEVPVRDNAP